MSVDSSDGISTGVSAADRALTIRKLSDPSSVASDFRRPGHVFPLKANERGVLSRRGHTEAALDLCKLAGKGHGAVLCEMMHDDGEMMRLPSLLTFAVSYLSSHIAVETPFFIVTISFHTKWVYIYVFIWLIALLTKTLQEKYQMTLITIEDLVEYQKERQQVSQFS